jgi:hypothetical protein
VGQCAQSVPLYAKHGVAHSQHAAEWHTLLSAVRGAAIWFGSAQQCSMFVELSSHSICLCLEPAKST